jgi:outer membrane protein assembly factor BamB
VWTSEVDDIGGGRGQAPRYGFKNVYMKPHGGCASPIIADGRLFQVWMRPVGDEYHKDVVDGLAAKWSEREGYDLEKYKTLFSTQAADVVACFDAGTGKTLWRKEFEGVVYDSKSGLFAKPRGQNNGPAVGDGRLYALGYGGIMRAFDVGTGEVLWQWGKQGKTTLFAPPVRSVDGVVLFSINSRTVIALDGATGEELWQAKDAIDRRQVVAIWRREASSCFITSSRGGTIACIEARSGKRLWELKGKGHIFNPTVGGDLLLINETNSGGGQPVAELACYRMSDTGAEQLWVNKEEAQLSHAAAAAKLFYKDRFIVGSWAGPKTHKGGKKQGRAAIRFFDAKTGKVDDTLRMFTDAGHPSLAPDSMISLVGDLLYIENDSHHTSNTVRTIVDLKTNKFVQYKSPFVTDGGYGGTVINQPIVDGRLYLRCADGHLRCYDVTAP